MRLKLLLLNGALFLLTIYMLAGSRSAAALAAALLFGASLLLLSMQGSRLGNRLLVWTNAISAVVISLVALIGLVGGLINYGPGALAVSVLFIPVAVLIANSVYGKRMLAFPR